MIYGPPMGPMGTHGHPWAPWASWGPTGPHGLPGPPLFSCFGFSPCRENRAIRPEFALSLFRLVARIAPIDYRHGLSLADDQQTSRAGRMRFPLA